MSFFALNLKLSLPLFQVHIFRLFCHEALRVFHDRLINSEDKNYFYKIISEMANKHFGQNVSMRFSDKIQAFWTKRNF